MKTFRQFMEGWYSDRMAQFHPSYTELEDQEDEPRSFKGGPISNPSPVSNDLLDQLPAGSTPSAYRGGGLETNEPVVAPEGEEDGSPMGVTDCDYCGDIAAVSSDGAGGKICNRCREGNSDDEPEEMNWEDPEPETDPYETPELYRKDRNQIRGRHPKDQMSDNRLTRRNPPAKYPKTWKAYRQSQYRN